ncbi:hypothetical protein B1813_10190 [Saccharomonospora piscinae]|uniref:HTH tetR-type domain-containing protein n=1 Tax=Saccharomonospora piscinae TaxID=687388 RepID=A0A1V9A639_SACPI|nr:hypothetical protein B1813_10190 [Saccharomonospora piscinae]TLW91747.1 TetR/AcrR family transcriptional regulator [Saccharomonospora piscinae]
MASVRDNEGGSTPKQRLVDAAIRLLAAGGPEAVQARRVAAEVGASSMAVYTHFGGMPDLVDAVVREGFERLDRRLAAVSRSDDALCDAVTLGLAYRAEALENSQLYRLMFGITAVSASRRGQRTDLLGTGSPTELEEGRRAFGHLVAAVERLAASGRGTVPEPSAAAAQLWSAVHGYVLLEIAGFFGDEGHGVEQVLLPLAVNLAAGLGDDRAAAEESARRALRRAG